MHGITEAHHTLATFPPPMSTKLYTVALSLDQRQELERLVKTGARKAFTRQRAQIWLRVDQGPLGLAELDVVAAAALSVIPQTVVRARQAWVRQGMVQGLLTQPMDHPRNPRRLDGVGETELVKLASGPAPAGQAHWTLQLLADKLVALQVVDSIAKETVPQTLKKRIAALAAANVVFESHTRRGLRLRHGGGAGHLSEPAGPAPPGGLRGRTVQDAACACALAAGPQARTGSPSGLRVQTPRASQPVHDDRPLPELAHPRHRHAGPRDRRLVPPPQPDLGSRAVALHHCGCPDQTAQTIPDNIRRLQY